MVEINVGAVATVTTGDGFKVGGVLTDPTTVTLKWRHGGDAITTWVYGTDAEIVKDGVGLYHADILTTESGLHWFRWEGDGAVLTAEEASFVVAVTHFADGS